MIAGLVAADLLALLAAFLLIPVAAFFSAAQTAFNRLTLTRALKLQDDGRRGAHRVVALMADPVRTLNTLALLVLAAEVVAIALLTVVAVRRLPDGAGVAAAAVVGAAALFVGAEVAPKTHALQRPEAVALRTARWVAVLARPLLPFTSVLIRLGNVLAPGKGLARGPFVTEDDLREMIDTAGSDEVIEESERVMIHSIFELADTVVREIMVPRPDMVMVSADAPLSEVIDVVLRAGHSRVPVYRDDRDHIVGLIYAKDVLRRLHSGSGKDGPWDDLMRPPCFVPELKRVDALLRELQARKVHLAVVVDEYGATAGLVTIEDILEEIVGEIVDEYDQEEPLVEELGAGRWRVDARLPVDELDDLLDTHLPAEEWDTVGGLLYGALGHVPHTGERVDVDSVRLTAERVKGRRISKVLVQRLERDADETGAGP